MHKQNYSYLFQKQICKFSPKSFISMGPVADFNCPISLYSGLDRLHSVEFRNGSWQWIEPVSSRNSLCSKWLLQHNELPALVGCSRGPPAARATDASCLPWLVLLGDLLQRVPLGDGAAGVGQHVAPVPQLRPRRVAPQHDAADRLRRADAIVINNRDDQGHLLQTGNKL